MISLKNSAGDKARKGGRVCAYAWTQKSLDVFLLQLTLVSKDVVYYSLLHITQELNKHVTRKDGNVENKIKDKNMKTR